MSFAPRSLPSTCRYQKQRVHILERYGCMLAVIASVFAAATPSGAALIDQAQDPSGTIRIFSYLSCDLLQLPSDAPPDAAQLAEMLCFIDPLNVDAFQLDFQFDPNIWRLKGIEYIAPYVATASADLSRLSEGIIQDIAGRSALFPPPPGEVFLFVVRLEQLTPGLPFATSTVFASANDFLSVFDTESGQLITVGADDIVPATCIPEPATLALVAAGLMCCRRKLRLRGDSARRPGPTAAGANRSRRRVATRGLSLWTIVAMAAFANICTASAAHALIFSETLLGGAFASLSIDAACINEGQDLETCRELAIIVDPPVVGVMRIELAIEYDPAKYIFNASKSGFLCEFSQTGDCPPADAVVGTSPLALLPAFGFTPGLPLAGSSVVLNDTGNAVSLVYDLPTPLTTMEDINFVLLTFELREPVLISLSQSTVTYVQSGSGADFTQSRFVCTTTAVPERGCGSTTGITGVTVDFRPVPETSTLILFATGLATIVVCRARG